MKRFGNKSLFVTALLAGMTFVLGAAAYNKWSNTSNVAAASFPAQELQPDIRVSGQIGLDAIPQIKSSGIKTIIDLRPDGEAPDQPSADKVKAAARTQGMQFRYVPVPHGDIPEQAVADLSQAITTSPGPILLYCRSGRRAARTWSLAEASRPGGLEAREILSAVAKSGQSADDLADAIQKRVATRSK